MVPSTMNKARPLQEASMLNCGAPRPEASSGEKVRVGSVELPVTVAVKFMLTLVDEGTRKVSEQPGAEIDSKIWARVLFVELQAQPQRSCRTVVDSVGMGPDSATVGGGVV